MPRRRALGIITLAGVGLMPRMAWAAIPTPAQTEGPFYPRKSDRTPDLDNDLVKIEGAVKQAGGEILMFSGRVVDREGAPLSDSLVEIWQCDVNGRYLHRRDFSASRPRDPHFQGIGHVRTDARGQFAFRTIRPVAYPGRTPHIHMKVHDPRNGAVLTTQIYVRGEPLNLRDGLYNRMPEAERAAVTMPLARRDNGLWYGAVQIVL